MPSKKKTKKPTSLKKAANRTPKQAKKNAKPAKPSSDVSPGAGLQRSTSKSLIIPPHVHPVAKRTDEPEQDHNGLLAYHPSNTGWYALGGVLWIRSVDKKYRYHPTTLSYTRQFATARVLLDLCCYFGIGKVVFAKNRFVPKMSS
jgi:hypothetical protein